MEFNKNMKRDTILKGDIYYADLGITVGSKQGGIRPVVIIQNNTGNHFSPTVLIATITSKNKPNLPTHVIIEPDNETGLNTISTIELEQITTLDKSELLEKKGRIPFHKFPELNRAINVSFDS